jgi:hypothetical protein
MSLNCANWDRVKIFPRIGKMKIARWTILKNVNLNCVCSAAWRITSQINFVP